MVNFYLLLAGFAVVYVGLLTLLNLIPHVTIKYIGFFSLRGVTIKTRKNIIHIRKLSLRFNLFKTNNTSGFKLVNLEIVDLSITIKDDAEAGSLVPSKAKPKKKKKKLDEINLANELHFKVPKKVYEYFCETRIINRVNVHLFRCSITHKKLLGDYVAFLDYIRFDCQIEKDNQARFTVTLFNGSMFDKKDKTNKVSLFRNVEYYINCQTVSSCGMSQDANKVFVYLSDFKSSLSIGRLNIPLDYFHKPDKVKKQQTTATAAADVSDDPLPTKVIDVIKYEGFLRDLMQVYCTTEVRLEDFTLSHHRLSANLSNFVFSLDKIEKDDDTLNLKLLLYLTSFKFYHIGTKCLELPSANFSYEVCPLQFLKVAQSLLSHDRSSEETINFDLNFTITDPIVDLYYDQQDIVLLLLRDKMMKRRMKQMSHATGVNKKETILLKLDIASSLLRAISSRLTIVNTQVNLHVPPLEAAEGSKFNRYSKDNLKITFGILELAFKIFTRHRLLAVARPKKSSTFNVLFKFKNARLEGEGNKFHFNKVNLLAAYNLIDKNVSLKFTSKSLELKSVNDLIFHLVRQFRNRQRLHFNKKYDEWKLATGADAGKGSGNGAEWKEPTGPDPRKIKPLPADQQFKEIFKILPHFVSTVKFDISNVVFDMCIKEGLPHHKIFDNELDKEVDLADFRRGMSLKIANILFVYKLQKEFVETKVTSLQVFTLSEYASEFMKDFDRVTQVHGQTSDSEVSDLSSIDSAPYLNDGDSGDLVDDTSARVKSVLGIPEIYVSNSSRQEDKDPNKLTLSIPEIEGRIDMFFLWVTFYVKTMLQRFKPTIESSCTKEQIKIITGPKKKFKLDVNLDSVAIVIRLPRQVDVMLEFDTARLKNVMVLKSAAIRNARLYVVDPGTKLWARMLIIKEPKFSIDLAKSMHDAQFDIVMRSFRISVPNRFKFYTVIDNFITFFKSIKQLKHNFLYFNWGIDEFERLFPKARHALIFPHIHIKTQVLGLELEPDAFENELAMIYELGRVEQKERLAKWKAFEKQAEEIRAGATSDIEDQIALSDAPAPIRQTSNGRGRTNSSLRKLTRSVSPSGSETRGRGRTDSILSRVHSPLRSKSPEGSNHLSNGASILKEKIFRRRKADGADTIDESTDQLIPPTDVYSKRDAEERIAAAKQRLYANFSTAWHRKFRVFRDTKTRIWKDRGEAIWGANDVSEVMKNKFDIVEFNHGPPLTGALFRDVDLILDKGHIDDIDKFLYDYAKHQPKLVYSILAPLWIEIKASKFYMILKDYPLPVASFPRSSDPSKPTVHIKTNLVIHEQLYHRQEELRYIYVPFSPAVPDNGESDNFYSVYIPRTLQPVKFAADMVCDLNTDRACSISWCKSYQPAFSAMGAAFHNFSKPAIDDSPIGWWDKMPLMLHGKVQFNVANELCLHMKSGRDPHELVGKSAGFVFCWKNNVTLKIDGTINSKDLVTITSDDFVFAIPNYSIEEKNVWSLFYDDLDDPQGDVDLEAKKFSKQVIKLSSNEKVKWTLGMLFERNKHPTKQFSDQELRVHEFKPHYEVQITNPINEYHPDSYEGYRSDYVHMALSVISRSDKGGAHNAAYFTPLAFHHFFYWWDSVAHYSPPPIKRGMLFSQDTVKKPKIKFSPHLFTMKYQLIFDPVTICHVYMHSTTNVPSKKSKTAFTGLKGKFDICEIDLHQRKEWVTHENKKLNRTTKTRHLKMYQAEVNIENADVRVMNALFSDTSISGKLMSYLNNGETSSLDMSTNGSSYNTSMIPASFLKWMESVDVPDGDLSWIDPQDFVELEVREPLSPYPKLKVLPFFHSPKFSYYREFTLHKEGPFPFGNEPIHDCIMDLDKPAAVQSRILLDRINALEDDLKAADERLRRYKIQNGPEYQEDIRNTELEIKTLKEKIEVVNNAYNNLSDEYDSGGEGEDDAGSGSLLRTTSKLSAYTSHLTLTELADASAFPSVVEFHNRFIIHNLLLKWDDDISKYFTSYLQRVHDRKNHIYYMTKYAVDLVERVINESEGIDDPVDLKKHVFSKDFKRDEKIVECFEDDLDDVANSDEEAPEYKYLVKLIHPQFQMISKKVPDACVVFTARDLELRIVDINLKERMNILSDNNEMTARIERRNGVLLCDQQLFVLTKSEVLGKANSKFAKHGYMTGENRWPPWFECEVCYDGSWAHEYLISERNTIAVISKSPNKMFVNSKNIEQGNEVVIYLSKYVINATSAQYSTIYFVITTLLLGSKNKKEKEDRLQKLVSLADASDFEGLDIRVKNLQQNIRDYKELLLNFDQRGANLNDKEKKYLHVLELEIERLKLELLLIMKTLQSRIKESSKVTSKAYEILADQVIWHMLDDDREPFIDFALANTKFVKDNGIDGSSFNKVEIGMVQGFNLLKNALYPQLLAPKVTAEQEKLESCKSEKPVITASWTTMDAVGGIGIVKNAKLEINPLQIELDYATAKKLQNYLFPEDDKADDGNGDSDSDSDDELDSKHDYILSESASTNSNGSTASHASKNPLKRLMSRRNGSKSSSSSSDGTKVASNSSNHTSFGSGGTATPRSSSSSFRSNEEHSLVGGIKYAGHKIHHPSLNRTKAAEQEQLEDDLGVIIARSIKYKSMIDIEIDAFQLIISFSAPKALHLLDVHRLVLNMPALKYSHKIWSAQEFTERLKKDTVKVILQHTGKILGNKIIKPKKLKHKEVNEPLKQISDYSKYMTLNDLQEEGRARDSSTVDHEVHKKPPSESPSGHRHHHHHHHGSKRHSLGSRLPSISRVISRASGTNGDASHSNGNSATDEDGPTDNEATYAKYLDNVED
ncbi:hypothetical protein Cantr_05907 [Candida viswanathii]|uniref:Protein FMP27, mitochondrial n=1 Tax=Candida viswanathii TaxID=5486 RepID=A0A367XRJ1_9ASCO|nr:hypothetical protein Cantr_05907 [Candida viswanathii]